jgi:hypothetical protein
MYRISVTVSSFFLPIWLFVFLALLGGTKLVDLFFAAVMEDPDDPERQDEVARRLMAYAARLREQANGSTDSGSDKRETEELGSE